MIIKPHIFLPSASIMSHITDQMASWETPASEHTGGTMRERQGGGGGVDLDREGGL